MESAGHRQHNSESDHEYLKARGEDGERLGKQVQVLIYLSVTCDYNSQRDDRDVCRNYWPITPRHISSTILLSTNS